jgi:hypothetical protein
MTLIHQLDSSVIGTMFSDTGKTTQITDGTAVAAWAAPNGSVTTDALQSTLANCPTYRANYSSSGYPGLEFDGSNDQMGVAHSSGWNSTIIDAFIVLTSTSNGGAGYKGIHTKFTDVNWNVGWGATYSLGLLSFGAPGYTNAAGFAVINQRVLMHVHYESGRNGCDQGSSIYVGGSIGTGPTNTAANVIIGGAPGGTFAFAGAMHEIRVYTGGETDQTVVDIKQALRKKWGIASVAVGSARPSSPFLSQVIG